MAPSLPAITTLPHTSDPQLTQVLDLLFEPSPALHALSLPVLRSATFPSYATLITAVGAQLRALATTSEGDNTQRLDAILCAHPRLGEKKVESEQSRSEQASLQQGSSDGEREELARLNKQYEETFPGLRYVYVFLFLLSYY